MESGIIGSLKTIQSSFSFYEDDPERIVNKKQLGGGSLTDIGCYSISLSRFLFNAEPKNVSAGIEVHPEFNTDTLAIIKNTPVPTPLKDAVDNLIVIERLFGADQGKE